MLSRRVSTDPLGIFNMDNDFDSFFSNPMTMTPFGSMNTNRVSMTHPDYVMPLDIYETKTSYTVVAQVAGIPKEKIEVELEGNQLILKATKQKDTLHNDPDVTIHCCQNSTGFSSRRVRLPLAVDKDACDIQCLNGMLRVQFQKHAPKDTPTKKLEIK